MPHPLSLIAQPGRSPRQCPTGARAVLLAAAICLATGACASTGVTSASRPPSSPPTGQPPAARPSSTTTTIGSNPATRTEALTQIAAQCKDFSAKQAALPQPGASAASIGTAAAALRALVEGASPIAFPKADAAVDRHVTSNVDAMTTDLGEAIRRAAAGDAAGAKAMYTDAGDHANSIGNIYGYYGADCGGPPQPHGQVQPDAVIDVGGQPRNATADSQGSVWVSLFDQREVVRVDASTNHVTATIAIDDDELQKLQVTPGGVWVRGRTAMHRIDPTTNTVVQTIPKSSIGSAVTKVYASGVEMWACDANAVERASSIDGHHLARIALPWTCGELSAGPGQVWVTSAAGEPGSVARIDPSTNTITATIAVKADGAVLPAIGLRGIWTDASGSKDFNAVRIDPATNTAAAMIGLPGSAGPGALTPTAYYVPVNGETVHQLLTATNTEGPTLDGGAGDAAATVSGGTLWIADEASGQLRRFNLS